MVTDVPSSTNFSTTARPMPESPPVVRASSPGRRRAPHGGALTVRAPVPGSTVDVMSAAKVRRRTKFRRRFA